MMRYREHCYTTSAVLAQQLATRIAQDLREALSVRGIARLAVSGGHTPKHLFHHLQRQSLDWECVEVTLVDERWVGEDSPDSNARLVREHLLQGAASKAHFLPLKTCHVTPYDAEANLNTELLPFSFGIDVIVLGMGADGHTASLFSSGDTYAQAIDPAGNDVCLGITAPDAPHPRLTLTLPTLTRARKTYLHIVGLEKREILKRAMSCQSSKLPIVEVLRSLNRKLDIFYSETDPT